MSSNTSRGAVKAPCGAGPSIITVPKLTVAEDFGVEIGANLRHNALQDRKQQAVTDQTKSPSGTAQDGL